MGKYSNLTDYELLKLGNVPVSSYSNEYLMHLRTSPKGARFDKAQWGKPVDTRTFQQYDRSNPQAQEQLEPAFNAIADPFKATIGGDEAAQQRILAKTQQAMTDPMAATFAGTGAKMADVAALGRAKQMLAGLERGTPEFLAADRLAWEQTGWTHAFPDGKPRFEIPDNQAQTLSNRLPTSYIDGYGDVEGWRLKDVLEHEPLYQSYPDVADIRSSFMNRGGFAQAEYRPFDGGWISYDKTFKKPLLSDSQSQTVEEAWNKVKQFDDQPHVKEYNAALEQTGDNSELFEQIYNAHNGDAIESARQPLVDEWHRVRKQAEAYPQGGTGLRGVSTSTTLHEVQHGIQDREGFARGGSPDEFTRQAKAELARDALSYSRELRRLRNQHPDADIMALENKLTEEYRSIGAEDMIPTREARDLGRQPYVLFHDKYPDNTEYQSLVDLVKTYGLDQRVTPKKPMELYNSLAGEAEARLTQKRISLTPDQRRQQYPIDQFDVPPEQQIVRMK